MSEKAAGAEGGARALQLIGGDKPQLRKESRQSWTNDKEEIFLSTLLETCNITRACAAAGVGVTSAYRRRSENAGFRSAWGAVIRVAYRQLEMVLLERAYLGVEKVVVSKAGEPVVMREYSNQLGIALLKMHRESAADAEFEPPASEIEEMRGRLIRKLQRLKKLDESGDAQTG